MTDIDSTIYDMHMAAQTPEAFRPEPQEPIMKKIDWQKFGRGAADLMIGAGVGIAAYELGAPNAGMDWHTSIGVLTALGIAITCVGAELRTALSDNPLRKKAGRIALAATIAIATTVAAIQSYDPGPKWGEEGFETQDGPEGSPETTLILLAGAGAAVAVFPRKPNESNTTDN